MDTLAGNSVHMTQTRWQWVNTLADLTEALGKQRLACWHFDCNISASGSLESTKQCQRVVGGFSSFSVYSSSPSFALSKEGPSYNVLPHTPCVCLCWCVCVWLQSFPAAWTCLWILHIPISCKKSDFKEAGRFLQQQCPREVMDATVQAPRRIKRWQLFQYWILKHFSYCCLSQETTVSKWGVGCGSSPDTEVPYTAARFFFLSWKRT